MADLSDACLKIVHALIAAPVAWLSPAEVAAGAGFGEEETTDALCELDLAGWVSVWEADGGPRVTLSALGAERMSVRLVEVGPDETPRWAGLGEPEPLPPRPKNVCASERGASLDFVRSYGPTPDVAAERFEIAQARSARTDPDRPRAARTPDDFPRPTQFVGLSLSPWPGPIRQSVAHDDCPACGSRRLRPQMYCIYCDRWGLDRLVPGTDPPPDSVPKPSTSTARTPERGLRERQQLEREKARRKEKRRRRHEAKVEAVRLEKGKKTFPNGMRRPGPGPVSQPSPLFHQPPASGKASESAAR